MAAMGSIKLASTTSVAGLGAAIAGIGELDDAGGRAEAEGGQLEQPIGGLIAADALEDFLTVPAYEKVLALGG